MASDLYIAFGADTGEMEAGLAAVRATAAEMRSLAAEMINTGGSADRPRLAPCRTWLEAQRSQGERRQLQ